MITEDEIIAVIKELEFPSIQKISVKLKAPRQYVAVLLTAMQEKGLIEYSLVGNNKIFRAVKK